MPIGTKIKKKGTRTMPDIYYAITPAFSTVTRYAKEKDFQDVYNKVLFITNDHATAEDAASWCELASVGEIYQHVKFTIEIIED